MTYITILFVSHKDKPDLYNQVLEKCQEISRIDSTFTVKERPEGEGIEIHSDTKDRAYRRGGWFKWRYGLNYQVITGE